MKNSSLLSSSLMRLALMSTLNVSHQASYDPALIVGAFEKDAASKGYSKTKSPVTKPKTGKARAKMAKASRRQQRMKK